MTGRDPIEAHDPLTAPNLPHAVRAQALKLLGRIQQVSTADDLFSAADRAEGVFLGLEKAKAMNPASLEALYVAFDNAATARRLEHEQ